MNSNLNRLAIGVLISFIPLNAYAIEWYDDDWQFRIPITINATEVNGTHTNFPILVNHTDTHFIFNADGDDFVFTDEDSLIKFDHEIELFNQTTGHLIAWVEIPTISNVTDQNIFMYYGDMGGNGPQNNTAGTWNSNYMLVYHGNDYLDSTSNDNDGTNIGTTIGLVDQNGFKCPIGNCYNFDGVNDGINSGNSSLLDFDFPDPYTVQMWWNGERDENTDNQPTLFQKVSEVGSIGYLARHSEVQNQTFMSVRDEFSNSDSQTNLNYPPPMPRETLVLSHWSWDGNILGTERGISLFDNGTETSNDDASVITNTMNNTNDFHWGQSWNSNLQHEGRMDEMRISNIELDPDWIQTEWNNHNIYGPNNFLIYGSFEEPLGLAPGRDTIYLRVAPPVSDRLGGVFAHTCSGGRMLGIDTNGTIICSDILLHNFENETQNLQPLGTDTYMNMSGTTFLDSVDFTVLSNGTAIVCNYNGLVKVDVSIVTRSITQRASANMETHIDGSPIGSLGATGYVRGLTNHLMSSLHSNSIGTCNIGSLIQIAVWEEAAVGTVQLRFTDERSSHIILERLG